MASGIIILNTPQLAAISLPQKIVSRMILIVSMAGILLKGVLVNVNLVMSLVMWMSCSALGG